MSHPILPGAPTEIIPPSLMGHVAPDQFAQVEKALYSLPREFVGKRLRARADRNLVRFYYRNVLVKTHVRVPPGKRGFDRTDFPKEKTVYAMRDVAFLEKQAYSHGDAVGKFAHALLDSPLPWTRMRQVYALLGFTKRYGDQRVNEACLRAVAVEMFDIKRLERMLKLAAPSVTTTPPPTATVIPLGRYLRPASDYALACVRGAISEGDENQ